MMRKWAVMIAVVTLGLVLASRYVKISRDDSQPAYRLATVERGPLVSTVTASGTLDAVVTVQVGSQVSGQIATLEADYNAEVRAGQVIARIDPAKFEALVREAEADLAIAQATVATERASVASVRSDSKNAQATLTAAHAEVDGAQARLDNSKRQWDRGQDLQKHHLIAESELERVQVAYESALAQLNATKAQAQAQQFQVESKQSLLAMAEAKVEDALAQVKQKEAALRSTRIDLEHTVIRAPIDGVIIERSVDLGQTVAASLEAPKLFKIAQDLRKMQVDTLVDEADIGQIQPGQAAVFSVDAFPRRQFVGEVVQIRKAPQVNQSVVTYHVIIAVDNTGLQLLPGMTANVVIKTQQRENVLKVPNAALRFRPLGANEVASPAGGRPAAAPGFANLPAGEHTPATVWLPTDDGRLRPLNLLVDISDGHFTEVVAGELKEAQTVVVGYGQPPGQGRHGNPDSPGKGG
jgi:HlyD family secretion protein